MKKVLAVIFLVILFFNIITSKTYAQICLRPSGEGINTAIGCIPVFSDDNQTALASWIIRWAVGIGGGIAFLLILYAGFQIITSQGVPDKIKAGQELITAAISGLLLLIFSVFILEYIGVKIIGLPLGP